MPSPVTVSLSAWPNPVRESSSVTVTATLRVQGQRETVRPYDVTVPVRVYRGTSEAGDHGTLESITIPREQSRGSATIRTAQDGDSADETFQVSLGSLPP